MSQFTDEMAAFTKRLRLDGYPTAIMERATERMIQLENEVLRLHKELEVERMARRSIN